MTTEATPGALGSNDQFGLVPKRRRYCMPTIDRVVLHGTPGDEPGSLRMHPVRPYDGKPRLTETLPMKRLEGMMVSEVDVHYVFTHTDEHGIPHYRRIGKR